MLFKFGESIVVNKDDLKSIDTVRSFSSFDGENGIEARLCRFANELKVIAPQAKDFLYFTCVMMHAAEAALLNADGSVKKLSNGKNAEARWEPVGKDSVKWVCNADIRPYKNANCLVPGTDILMGDGSCKAIEDVVVGDEVLTHKGRVKKVKEIFKHEINAEIYHLKAQGHPVLSTTLEHPLYALSGENVRKKKLHHIIEGEHSLDWKKTEEICAGDFLSSIGSTSVIKKSDITPGQARLLGYFAAEGSFSKKYEKRQSVNFTFGYHEKKIVQLAKSLIEEEFPECSVRVNDSEIRGVTNLTISGYGIAEWFYYHIGEYSHTKKLSAEIVFGSDEIKRQFLLGWIEGDGCLTTGNKLVGISVSPHLAWQTWLMARTLGLSVSIRKTPPVGNFINKNKEYPRRDNYRIEIYGANAEKICGVGGIDSAKYVLKEVSHKNIASNIIDGVDGDIKYTLQRMRNVDVVRYTGPVYNFEVEEDHSYIANGLIVHNSDIFPASDLKIAYKKWVGKPLCLDHKSDSVDKIRGVIIDTYWDDKRKRIIALCALDKKNYPDLADKVSTGVAPCVSMGTAVGKAICTEEGCHRVARTEKDFCIHMQTKSGYGEINKELNPLELSLVVNGADPGATVKHVIAKNMKEEELKDLSKAAELLTEYLFVKEKYASVSTHELEDIKRDLEALNAKVQKLEADSTESTESEKSNESNDVSDVVGPTRSKKIDELIPANSTIQMMPPEATPTVNSSVQTSALQRYIFGAKRAIASLQDKVVKTTPTIKEDSVMGNKLGYFQGTLEPNRGGQTYTPEPMQMKVREEDRFLDAKPTGKVDELFPGDKETKEHLQRMADVEERKMFREAALQKAKAKLQKGAYFQGTEEPVDIGKTQYKPDPMQMKVREEDKFLEGPKPFPGVGDVEGLYGDDLKEKEMLLRASLKAKFHKGSSKAESAWVVYAGEKPVLKLSVNDLSKGQPELFYDGIATKVFGQNLLTQIKNRGLGAAQQFLKAAQPAPGAPPPMAPPPMAPPAADGAPGAPEAPEQVGEHAEPAQIVHDLDDLTDEMKAKLSDLQEGVAGPVGEDMKQLDGVEPASTDQFAAAASTGKTPNILGMRKATGTELFTQTNELMAKIAEQLKEVSVAKEIYAKYRTLSPKQKAYLNQLSVEAIVDSKSLLKRANMIQKSAANYAFGVAAILKTASLTKQAQEMGGMDGANLFEKPTSDENPEAHRMEEDQKLDQFFDTDVIPTIEQIEKEEHTENPENPETSYEEEHDEHDEEDAKDGKVESKIEKDRAKLEKVKEDLEKQLEETKKEIEELEEVEEDEKEEEKEEKGEDKDDLKVEIPPEALQNAKVTSGVQLGNLMTKAQRAEARIKLAKEGLQSYEHLTDVAHPQGSVEMPGEQEKTQMDSKFHIPADIKEYMMNLAELPPKVKQAIERIDTFVREGKLDPKKVDELVAHGVDPAAVKYWKQYWAQAKEPECNDFAKKLTEESINSKASDEKKIHEAKLARSYDLAYQMFANGSINQNQISSQAAEIMKWNDEAFESLKRTLLKNKSSEKANVVGNIGLLSSGDIYLPGVKVATASAGPTEVGYEQLFEAYFQGKKL